MLLGETKEGGLWRVAGEVKHVVRVTGDARVRKDVSMCGWLMETSPRRGGER